MDHQEAEFVLRMAFTVFTTAERENVRWHLTQGTPVLCSRRLYVNIDGSL